MDKILDDAVVGQIQDAFEAMKEPVQILFFGSKKDCDYCQDAEQLLTELAATHEHIGLSIYDLEANGDVAAQFQVDKAPAIVIAAKDGAQITDLGIRFSGTAIGT